MVGNVDPTVREEILKLAAQHHRGEDEQENDPPEWRRWRLRHNCYRKEAYSRDMAILVAQRIKRNQNVHVNPYHCKFCNHWHVGRGV